MGQEIVYCSACQTRLLAADFENGSGFWIDERCYCVGCVMGLLSTLPPEQEQLILKKMALRRGGKPGENLPAPTPRRETSTRRTGTERIPTVGTDRRPAPPPAARNAWVVPMLMALAGALVATLAILSARHGNASRPPAPVAAAPGAPTPPPPPPAEPRADVTVPREDVARKALERAKGLARKAPEDFSAILAAYEEALWECRGTSSFPEAKQAHEEAQKRQGDFITARLRPVADEARDAGAREKFAQAIDLLEKARPRYAMNGWGAAVGQKILEVRHQADRLYASVKEGALDAKRRDALDEAKAAILRVEGWGLADLTADLKKSLGPLEPRPPSSPAPPPVSPEVRAYADAWEKALALARARDYPAALQHLEGAPAPGPLRAEADADLEILKLLSAAHADVLQALSKWPKSQKLSLEFEDGAGNAVQVEGTVARATGAWIEIRRDPDVFVIDLGDLTAESLGAVLRKLPGRKTESNARAAALFGLLDGNLDAAAKLPAEALAEKYRAYGARVAEERTQPARARKEAEARAAFFGAERDFRDPVKRPGSFDQYRKLQELAADVAFLRRKLAVIRERLEGAKDAGKEYFFFADDLRAAGAFRRTAYLKASACWTSAAEVASEKDNYVEFAFAALPDVEYRAWAFVGGCCADTFTFSCQGTEMGAEPGAAAGLPVKHQIPFLKKSHAAHGGRKEPSRFEWVALALPKYASPGPKSVRILSTQQGFSVGYAFVSALRAAPPAEAAIKEWERVRPSAAAAGALFERDPSLVACWKLDDGQGTMAVDSSPNGLTGTLRNGPVWTAGRQAGALSFDGSGDYVEIPKGPKLYLPGSFTVAAWVNIAMRPKADHGMYVVSDYAAGGTRSTFGLRIRREGTAQFLWQTVDGTAPMATSTTTFEVDVWHHLAGVWDGTTRRLYVDGVQEAALEAPQNRPDVGENTAIGRAGSFNSLYFRGKIDDVRIYARALSAAEVLSLAGRARR